MTPDAFQRIFERVGMSVRKPNVWETFDTRMLNAFLTVFQDRVGAWQVERDILELGRMGQWRTFS